MGLSNSPKRTMRWSWRRCCSNMAQPQDALEIAEHGLSLAGELWTLASWLRDESAAAGDADRATRAALVALRELHSLADYQTLRTVVGNRWPALRDEVLAELRQAAAHSPSGIGAIF